MHFSYDKSFTTGTYKNVPGVTHVMISTVVNRFETTGNYVEKKLHSKVGGLSSGEVIMITKCQVSVSSLLLGIPKAKKRKITSAE